VQNDSNFTEEKLGRLNRSLREIEDKINFELRVYNFTLNKSGSATLWTYAFNQVSKRICDLSWTKEFSPIKNWINQKHSLKAYFVN